MGTKSEFCPVLTSFDHFETGCMEATRVGESFLSGNPYATVNVFRDFANKSEMGQVGTKCARTNVAENAMFSRFPSKNRMFNCDR